MKLKSFGCSFVYGSDLSDCPHGVDDDNPPPSWLTWPALLASKYDLEYQCLARPAASNIQILETLLSNINDDSTFCCVINWTWIERFGYISQSHKTGRHLWNPRGWTTILPSQADKVSDLYYKHLHSEFRDKLETLICIRTAIDVLQKQGIKFVMTYTDDLIFQDKWHTSPAIDYLQKSVRPWLSDFQGQCFMNWAKNNGFKISDSWHPLEEAHRVAADLLAPTIDAILRKA